MDQYNEEYKDFLKYQAEILRKCRPKLTQRVEKHRSDLEVLKAHTENQMMLMETRQMSLQRRIEDKMEETDAKTENQLLRQRK
ncbi:MAG: hypothetical protein V2I33_17860 [Kangiellaceae bacterium]|jgi:hypothetical protein|nr:hypothetical protein [Kangiellaceae bacterium]